MNFTNNKNYSFTENGATALKSTGSNLLDLFSVLGAIRNKSYDEVSEMFQDAFSEDKLLSTKLLFFARNIRGGLGERETFRKMLRSLALSNPEIVIKNLDLIPFFGRFDDLYTLVGTKAERAMWYFVRECMEADWDNMLNGKSVSLCAKWMKSANTSSKESVKLGKLTAKALGISEKDYRKLLAQLRAHIKVTESKMSAGEWKEIQYSGVPSRAMKNYRKAFGRHDPDGFSEYISNVTKGVAKINSSTLYPYDILEAAGLRHDYNFGYRSTNRKNTFQINKDAVLEAQWKALPNYVKAGSNALVMADTSGSMDGRPMAIALGLAIYFAERNIGAYKDLFLTFSESPHFVHLKGDTLAEKVTCIESIVANTNLELAMDLILKVAVESRVAQEDMPKTLIVISDMQFDGAVNYSGSQKTFHRSIVEKFEKAGYVMPQVVYWNVQERTNGTFQAKANDAGVLLVSGAATSTFKAIVGNIGKTPLDLMYEVLNDEMYSMVKI